MLGDEVGLTRKDGGGSTVWKLVRLSRRQVTRYLSSHVWFHRQVQDQWSG